MTRFMLRAIFSAALVLPVYTTFATDKNTSKTAKAVQSEVKNTIKENPTTRSEWKAILNWPKLCDEGASHIIDPDDFPGYDVYPWSEGRQLVSVVCTTGAYDLGLMFFLETAQNSGEYTLLSFPQFIADDDAKGSVESVISGKLADAPYYQFDIPLLWGSLYNDMSNYTLTNENRYRGPGGCGVLTSYQIIDNQVKVTQLKIKRDCDETNPPAEAWPEIPRKEFSKWPKVTLKGDTL